MNVVCLRFERIIDVPAWRLAFDAWLEGRGALACRVYECEEDANTVEVFLDFGTNEEANACGRGISPDWSTEMQFVQSTVSLVGIFRAA